MTFSTSEHDLVDFAVWILGHHRAQRTVGADWTATMTDRKITAGEAIFVFNKMLGPIDELLPSRARGQHARQIRFAENVSEKTFRIAGDPAIALGDGALCIH